MSLSCHHMKGLKRPGLFVHVRWPTCKLFGMCDSRISSFCRGVLVGLLALHISTTVYKKKVTFYQISVFWKNTHLKCKTNHHSAQCYSVLAAIASSCTIIDCYINCAPRVFSLVLFCFVSGCADVNEQSLLAEPAGRDGKKPKGRLNWVMWLFGEFHY